jgi:putative ABC transport system substrate-binding protein
MAIQIRRREFVVTLSGAAVWPLAARAQQRGQRRVGVVLGFTESDPEGGVQRSTFRQELQRLGWIEGQNIRIDYRYPIDQPERIRALGAELLSLSPDLIVSMHNLVTVILRSQVSTIPLVFIGASDPIGSGIVTDIARPTGNVTGFANFDLSMGAKWLDALKEIAPRVERVGFILHPETTPHLGFLKSAETAASVFHVKLDALAVHSAEEIERRIAAFADNGNGGLIVAPHAVTFVHRDLIVQLAAQYRLPAIYPFAFFVRAGGLVSYGNNLMDQVRSGAAYVDRILRGAKPPDLPVQYPTRFELVINLKTTKALDLQIPDKLLALADDVIE